MSTNTEKPRPLDNGLYCPLWRQKISKVCHHCEWYVELRGTDKNTGNKIDHWGCSIRWSPVLQVETTTETRQAAASSDKAASEMEALRIAVQSLASNIRAAMHGVEVTPPKPVHNIAYSEAINDEKTKS